MSFPSHTADEAGFRALEPRCAHPHSAETKRIVENLAESSQACKDAFLYNAVHWGLPNLVRCSLEAGASASSRSDCAVAVPVLAVAAGLGHARVLKHLLEAGADHRLWIT